ncbi:MAG TPA: ABC transporter permease [Thermoanaerobaculia bacterium]|jgi:predicted permease|nr:ABC transporter permease [Thermoanaerobaculia bacterium]
MTDLLGDVRGSLRSIMQRPAFSAALIVTLALGIGACVAIFAVLDAAVLRPAPYPEPERIASVLALHPSRGPETMSLSPADFLALRAANRSFSTFGAYVPFGTLDLAGEGDPVRLPRFLVSEGALESLALRPSAGQLFVPSDYRSGAPRVVAISHRLWRSRFSGDPSIVGRNLALDGELYEVVGVLPATFRLPGGDPDMVLPLVFPAGAAEDRESAYLGGLGRLRPGVTPERAEVELSGLAHALIRKGAGSESENDLAVRVEPLGERYAQSARTGLWAIFGAVSLVLLLAAVNVASLHLVRAVARERELAVRRALGASTGRIVRQLVVESLLYAAAAGALALLLAEIALRTLPDPRGVYLPKSLPLALGASGLAFAAAATIGSALLAVLPALWRAGRKTGPGLIDRPGTAGTDPGRERLHGGLVIAEVALAFVLLAGAGLLVRSFRNLLDQDLGYRPERALTFDLTLPESRYPDAPRVRAFYRDLLDRIGTLPGVVAVGGAKEIPPAEPWSFAPEIEGEPTPEGASAGWQLVTPGYFEALGASRGSGETIGKSDRAGGRRVTLLDATAARDLLGGKPAIGRRLRFNHEAYDIVGIAPALRRPDEEASPRVYLAFDQEPVPVGYLRGLSIVVRTSGDPIALAGPVRDAVRTLDRDLPVSRLLSFEQRLAEATPLAKSRFNALLSATFGALALLLAAVGIYGVLSFSVRLRTREIGVRAALGASRRELLALVLRRGLSLALFGVALGAILAVAGSRGIASLQTLWVGIGGSELAMLLGTGGFLLAISGLACWLPARRASRVNPSEALRQN